MSTKKNHARQELDSAMREAMRRFGHRENITGFDVGFRWNGGKPTTELCVRIHVERKIPKTELETAEIFPGEIDGIPLDVIQGHYKVNRETRPAEHRARTAVLMGGFSCGRYGDGTGTIGAMVIDNETGRPAILSNWHVLAGARARIGDPIMQPGEADGGMAGADEVASLRRWILDADGDAALATVDGRRPWLPLQFGLSAILDGVRDSVLGEILHKSGRTTGRTKGRVDGEGIYRLVYEVRPGITEKRDIKGFKLVPELNGNPSQDEISAPGDSGGLWVNPITSEAVGLHFAGEGSSDPLDEHAIACHLTRVMARLDVRLATVDDVIRGETTTVPHHGGGGNFGRPELSVVPDWPFDPWQPYPWPRRWPWPRPRGGWPQFPHYRPGYGGTPFEPRIGVPDLAGPGFGPSRGETFGSAAERAVEQFSLTKDIWPRLYAALFEYNPIFEQATPTQPVARYFSPPDAARYVIAHAINASAAFDDLGLRRVEGADFRSHSTFLHICADIVTVLHRQQA